MEIPAMSTTILAVDDSKIIRKIISGAINLLGYDFLEAEDGQKALQVLLEHKADISLVLLDWNMPNLDGYQTLQAIKADPTTKHIPVMMVTTESERTNVVKAVKAGASNYLTKPFSQDDLITKIMECLEAVTA
jgi:two-component system, chemotaxis family, chemotaxis protein CheY